MGHDPLIMLGEHEARIDRLEQDVAGIRDLAKRIGILLLLILMAVGANLSPELANNIIGLARALL